MKEAIIIDLNGYITDVTLVTDNVTGVFPIYKQSGPKDNFESVETFKDTVLEQELVGYTVAIPVPEGLYKPRFDLAAWELYNQRLDLVARGEFELETDGCETVNKPKAQQIATFWVEGITPEELAAIRNQQPSETDTEKITRLEAEKEDLKARLGDMELVMAEILMERGK
ncbi:hypothetical protein [Paenibacillus sp. 32352]|uniref:hypothetical protein n=1 Tax=Paenibacillus sp. 32352 TaxID=1969111 RepID=UPI0009AD36F7|nr:hypothetical protein [Paenibacillus sp. 32352]